MVGFDHYEQLQLDKRVPKRPSKPGPTILTFALNHRPKTTRASGPKVRSGCDACKKRHVKCDEAKPSCQRCIKWQGFCDGYSPTTLSSNAGPRSSRGGKPKDSSPELLIDPEICVFKYEWEKVYFDHWQILAGNLGGGWFETNLFSTTVPQLSREEPVVRYAAIAIGALANAVAPNLLPESSKSDKALLGTDDGHDHYKVAVTYYGRAMRLLHHHKGPNDDATMRSALIACILFTSFEILHGSREAALSHINHGLKLVEHFVSRQQQTAETLPGGYVEYSNHSPAPLIVEDEILQVFQRLDYQSWTTGILDRWRRAPQIHLRAPGTHSHAEIPSTFIDLAEARRWWDLVLHWSLHFPRVTVEKLMSYMPAFSSSSTTCSSIDEIDPDLLDTIDFCDIPGLKDLQDQNILMLEAWHAAFLPLYKTAADDRPSNPAPYFQAASLLLQYHLSWVSLRTACFSDYRTMYTLTTPRFREIVRLGELLIQNQPRADETCTEIFTLDNGGPTLALLLAAIKCRDRGVRAKAVDVLQKYPRRDAFWTTKAATTIGEVNMVLEDQNESDGTLLEQFRRLRRREGELTDRRSEFTGRFYIRDSETGGWEYQTHVVKW
ncbi:hypothetical protein B0H66DRAFT_621944 [Apodospora peruviana]|uniref:Zn(2)-C6 fungal-type domain-containing protein n=1 Tax=Apodospora peruviana TaxID=516989 RepID=A0AAE0M3T6_9PEZI|nr:hypothetical protein B0H66DRAFT_621944 [Apodospora peruviana]